MKPSWKSLISLLLVLVFVFQLFPASVLAVGTEDTDEEIISDGQSNEEILNETAELEHEKTYIIGEVNDLREESAKQFRMNDGTFVAVEYESPVHYQDTNGKWQDIDNTVRDVKGAYVIENGDMKKTFSSSLSDGKLFDLEYFDHRISFSLVATEEELLSLLPEPTPSTIPEIIELNPIESSSETNEEYNIEEVKGNEEKPEEMSEEASASETESDSEANAVEKELEEVLEASTPTPEVELENELPSIPAETTKEGTKYFRVQSANVSAVIENPVRKDKDPSKATMDEMIAPEMCKSEVKYENALKNTDFIYTNYGYDLKESIVVKQRQEYYRYSFCMSLDELTPELQKDGSVLLLDSKNSTIFEIPAPYMVDAKGNISEKVGYSLDKSDTGFILTVIADSEWLNDPQRSFPVMIDPTIIKHNDGGVKTAMIRHAAPNSPSPSYADLYCGLYNSSSSSYGVCEIVVQVESMPTLPQNCVVVNAEVMMAHAGFFTSNFANTSTGSLTIQAKKLNNVSSNVLQVTKNEVYNTLGVDSIVLDHQTLSNSTRNTYVSWDVTSAALGWISSSAQKGAFLLSPYDHQTQQRFCNLIGHAWGDNSPYFAVQYRNTIGIEDYYTYEQASAGRAGKVYIENFSNQYTIERPDVSLSLASTDFTITHYYNSGCSGNYFSDGFIAYNTCNYSNMILGAGWKLSIQQTVVQRTVGKDTYLVYTDADGTQHYFAKSGSSSTTFKDEDGLGLTITKSTSGGNTIYTMVDADVYNTWVFHNGYLISQIDHNGNAIYIAYNNNYSTSNSNWKPNSSGTNRIVQVVQHTDSSSAPYITVATLGYNSNNFLTSITDYAGRVTTFEYSPTIHLTAIHDPDGTSSVYSYNMSNSDLISAYDNESKCGLEFALTVDQLYGYTHRTLYLISEYSDNNGTKSYGNRIAFERNGNQITTVHNYGPDHSLNSNDDLITRNAFDYYGRTITSYTTNSESNKLLGVAAGMYIANSTANPEKNNRLSKSAVSGQHVDNLILDSGLEHSLTGSGWVKDIYPNDTGLANAVVGQAYTYGYGAFLGTVYPHMGQNQLKTYLWTTINPDTGYAYLEQGISLTAGTTYTFSAYVNTSTMGAFDPAHPERGSFIAFMDQNKNIKEKSEIINYNTEPTIENGWERISVTYTPTYTGIHYLAACQKGAKGITAYDDLQLEINDTFSCINLIQDAGFDRTTNATYWRSRNLTSQGTELHGKVVVLNGTLTNQNRVTQTININQPSSTTFLLSGWGKANSVFFAAKDENTNYDRFFGLIALITYTDNTTETQYVPFSPMYDGWQYCSGVIAAKQSGKTIRTIAVSCAYDKNANTAWFDDISLIREPAQTYVYDSKGNPVSATTENSKTSYEYYSGTSKLKKYTTPSSTVHTLTYQSGTNNIESETLGGLTNYTYRNSSGGPITMMTRVGTSGPFLKSTIAYDAAQNHKTSTTDINKITTTYGYSSTTHNLTSMKRGSLPTQSFTYTDSNNRLKKTRYSGYDSISYSYSAGNLSGLERVAYTTVGGSTPFWQKYNLKYDSFGNNTSVTVKTSTDGVAFSSAKKLVNYTYESTVNQHAVNNGRLSSMTYANGNTITYGYDVFDRIISETYNNGKNYRYYYDSEGNLSKQESIYSGSTEESYRYDYDSLGRLIHSKELDSNNNLVQRTEHLYDTSNRLTKQSWMFGNGASCTQSYTYSTGSSGNETLTSLSTNLLVGTESMPNWHNVTYSYNSLRQLTRKTTGSLFYRAYAYKAGSETDQITAQVQYMNYRKTDDSLLLGYKYAYNGDGNISAIYHSLATGGASSTADQTYTYDVLGQLTRCVDNIAGRTYTYSYDTAGNIQTMNGGAGGNKTLTYGGDIWKDRLTKVQVGSTSENITYETAASGYISGNPTSYFNGRHYDFTWMQGRQLATARVGGVTTSYTYDMAGVRSSKTVGSTEYKFDTLSGLVTRQTWSNGQKELYFVYDDSNQPYLIAYRSSPNATPLFYFYILNQQGDVVAIANGGGNIVCRYSYDPWGAVSVGADSSACQIGTLNPLRYRGYYYDTETGLYYLQSRYYDPAIGRFINADTFATTDADSFLSCNMFAYCENNPVNRSDATGELFVEIAVGVVNAGVSALSAYVCGGDKTDILIAAGTGFLNGALKNNSAILAINAIAAVYNGVKTGIKTGNVWKGVGAGLVSFGSSFISSNTLNGEKIKAGLNAVCSAAFDGTFGFGAQLTSNAFQKASSIGINKPSHNNSRNNSYHSRTNQNAITAKAPRSIHGRKAELM